MPITKIDDRAAFIVIDLQKGIAAMPTAHSVDGVVKNVRALADAFRQRGLPVVLVNVAGGAPGRADQPPRMGANLPAGWADLLPELNQRPEDLTVTKKTWGAFTNTGLEQQLKKLGVTQIVLAGISTSAGVESTARDAHALGFNVTLATDAMTDSSSDAHNHSVTRIFPRLGETGSTRQIIDQLQSVAV